MVLTFVPPSAGRCCSSAYIVTPNAVVPCKTSQPAIHCSVPAVRRPNLLTSVGQRISNLSRRDELWGTWCQATRTSSYVLQVLSSMSSEMIECKGLAGEEIKKRCAGGRRVKTWLIVNVHTLSAPALVDGRFTALRSSVTARKYSLDEIPPSRAAFFVCQTPRAAMMDVFVAHIPAIMVDGRGA